MAANPHNPTTLNTSSPLFPQEPDDISLFLQQIILRSSSSSSSAIMRHQPFAALSDQLFAGDAGSGMGPGQITAPDPHPLLNSSTSGCGPAVGNVSSFSTVKLDNEADDYDYESEEVVEAVMEETAPKPTPSRSSSKRSRAAEVHNQSEKRRRSRINEKMKALQNLIPNSNKTDKASMLDEAIEYLKQLQLQVQMLTMRNGLSLYPVCVPGMLQTNQYATSQMRTETYGTHNFTNVYTTESVSVDPNISADALVGSQEKCAKRGPVIDYSTTVGGSKSSLKVESESSMLDHFGSFQQSRSYQGICEEKVQPCQPLNDDRPRTAGIKTSCETTNISDLKEMPLDAFCLAGGDQLLQNFINHPIFSSAHLDM